MEADPQGDAKLLEMVDADGVSHPRAEGERFMSKCESGGSSGFLGCCYNERLRAANRLERRRYEQKGGIEDLAEWEFAQHNASDHLSRIEYFSMVKRQDGRDIEFRIAVHEYVTPKDPAMKFFAQADKQTNQKTAPYTPCGWGPSTLKALSECIVSIHRFPYQGD
jgi:hypothetical protein